MSRSSVGDRPFAGSPRRVQHGRVDLQRHVVAQPVVDHRRDQRPVLVDLGLGSRSATRSIRISYGVRPCVVAVSSPAASACSSKCSTIVASTSISSSPRRTQYVSGHVSPSSDVLPAGWYFERTAPDARDLEERSRLWPGSLPTRSAISSSCSPGGERELGVVERAGRLRARRPRRGRPCPCARVGAGLERPALQPRRRRWNTSAEPTTSRSPSSSPICGTLHPSSISTSTRRRRTRPAGRAATRTTPRRQERHEHRASDEHDDQPTDGDDRRRRVRRGPAVAVVVGAVDLCAGRHGSLRGRLQHHRRRDLVDHAVGAPRASCRASRSARSAMTVVRRSSWMSTVDVGPPRRHAAASTSSSAACARPGPLARQRQRAARPRSRSASASRAAARIAWWSVSRLAAALRGPEWGEATVPDGSESASPIAAAPRSTPDAASTGASRCSGLSCAWPSRHRPFRVPGRARRRPRRRSGPPPCDDVGALAGAAAERLRRRARDRVGRRALLDEVLAHRDRDRGLRRRRGADERDDARAERVTRLRARAGAARPCRGRRAAPTTTPSVASAARSPAPTLASFGLQPSSSSLQRLHLLDEPLDPLGHLLGRDAQELAGAAQQLLLFVDVLERALAGDRLDAAQVGADRALAHDLDRADEAERVHVRAAAQLDRVLPRLEHAHEVAVLVAEERDRADALGVLLAWSRSGGPARR